MRTYSQLDDCERRFIAHHRVRGKSLRWIAGELGRSPSTISREVKRNYDKQNGPGHYKAKRAQEQAGGRRRRRRGWSWFTLEEWSMVWVLLEMQYSPEQIAGRLGLESRLSICHETIYRRIWRDKAHGGTLYLHLRHSGKLRRKRYGSNDSRGRLAGKRPLGQRPAGSLKRSRRYHWEIDTVVGPDRPALLTLVDRKTGYLHIRRLDDRTSDETNYRLRCLLRRHPGGFRTITADNGCEFHGYKDVEEIHPVRFYFAPPYHSWERGSSENANGLIRQYVPKGSPIGDLNQEDCDRIAKRINNRPRKRLGWKTPEEIHKR